MKLKRFTLFIGVMDGLAAAMSCGYITEQDIKDMEFYISSMDLAIESSNYSMYYKLQEEFHNVYMAVCPNKSLVNLLIQLKKKFLKKIYEPEIDDDIKDVLFDTNEEHRTIIRLMKEKDTAGLEAIYAGCPLGFTKGLYGNLMTNAIERTLGYRRT